MEATEALKACGENVLILDAPGFDLAKSCSCGQCFRWRAAGKGVWQGVAQGHAARAWMEGSALHIYPGRQADKGFWRVYFDLARDYGNAEARMEQDSRLHGALEAGRGIRIFRQEPFEALLSFIISANNNIPRIQGIVERLCALCGRPLEAGGYAFPAPEDVARLQEKDLRAIGAGYRAPYLLRSARMVAAGLDLASLRQAPLADVRQALCALPGVGKKVADCVALYGLGHMEAFPMDVWMKRAVQALFFDGQQPDARALASVLTALGPEAGIIQQYIFYYARNKG